MAYLRFGVGKDFDQLATMGLKKKFPREWQTRRREQEHMEEVF